jgi:hypothetical protein
MACTKDCVCQKKDCPRHGKCCECIKSHRERGYLPACLRGKELPDLPPPSNEG